MSGRSVTARVQHDRIKVVMYRLTMDGWTYGDVTILRRGEGKGKS